jgi:mono/diheme cytochrome c family protein
MRYPGLAGIVNLARKNTVDEGRLNHGEHMRRLTITLATAGMVTFLTASGVATELRADDDANKIYKTNCVLCHAPDGSGSSPSGKALGAKDLASVEVQKKTDDELAEFINKGKGKMPAFAKKIKPEEIKLLVAFIRALPKKK